jgi:hypothetical protein
MISKWLRKLLLLISPLLVYLSGCSIHPFGDANLPFGQRNFFFGPDGGNQSFYGKSTPGNTSGSYWLAGQMDQYHNSLDVYTDFGSGGNHFVVKAVMGDTNISFREDYTNSPNSGDTAIEVTYRPSAFTNGSFINGTGRDGISPEVFVVTPMAQAIPLLALRDLSNYYTNGLKTTESNNRVVSNTTGTCYDFNTDKDGMYTEGNGWVALAYLMTNSFKTNTAAITAKATNIVRGMTNTNVGFFGSLYASTKDKLTTGFMDYAN